MKQFNLKRQQGISIVEIMISLTISMVLIAGVLQIFSGSKQTYRMQDALARIQENGRFALDVLTRDIRMADFWGCFNGSPSSIYNGLNTGSAAYDSAIHVFNEGVIGTEGVNDANSALDEPDTITLTGAFGGSVSVKPPYMPMPSSNLKVSADSGIEENDILLVSDCIAGDIFQVTNNPSTGSGTDDQVNHNTGTVSSGPGNLTGDLSKTYKGDAKVYAISTRSFEVDISAESNQPELYRTVDGKKENLVEGVENMQILYGEDTDDDGVANYYVNAGAVTDMDQVVSVRISILLRSYEDNLVSQPQEYTFNGSTATATDRRIRRVMTTTIAIRNRLT